MENKKIKAIDIVLIVILSLLVAAFFLNIYKGFNILENNDFRSTDPDYQTYITDLNVAFTLMFVFTVNICIAGIVISSITLRKGTLKGLAIAGLIISIVVLVVIFVFYLFVFTLSIISLANTKTSGISMHHYVSTMSTMPKISDNLNI